MIKSADRLPLVPAVLGVLSLESAGYDKNNEKGTPNIVIIYADDLGYGDVSCNGATSIKTPNIDRIAAQGLRFTNAHCTSATSTPSRYSLLTGEYAWRERGTGVAPGNASAIIEPGRTTIASGNDTIPQLYNIRDDIGEKINLAKDNPLIVNELTQLLLKIKTVQLRETL